MKTTLTIMVPGAEPVTEEHDLPDEPDFDKLREILVPHLNDLPERVRVLHEGAYTDMFVGDSSALRRDVHKRNEAATKIYRANWLSQHPDDDPEGLPAIWGPACLFSRPVWF